MMQQELFVCLFAYDPGFCMFNVALVVHRKMNMGGLGNVLENGGASAYLSISFPLRTTYYLSHETFQISNHPSNNIKNVKNRFSTYF